MSSDPRAKWTSPLLLLAALLPLAACASTYPEPSVRTREVRYRAGETEMIGYLAYDSARQGMRPGVLVVHEWWGQNEYARRRARELAEMGYVALALDMFGDGKLAEHPSDAQAFAGEVMSNREAATARFEAAWELLRSLPQCDPERVAAVGYCFGGGVVLHMARIGLDLDGVASFHGSLKTDTPAQPGAVRARLLVMTGGDDPFVPPEDGEALRAEMAAAGADLTFIAYPGVKHSFTNPDATALGERFDLPLVYDAQADQASWAELESFLAASFAR